MVNFLPGQLWFYIHNLWKNCTYMYYKNIQNVINNKYKIEYWVNIINQFSKSYGNLFLSERILRGCLILSSFAVPTTLFLIKY